jgi:hypothetical protein
MMYFWVIPVLLLAILILTLFFKEGTKRNPVGHSRLDDADSDSGREDLRS